METLKQTDEPETPNGRLWQRRALQERRTVNMAILLAFLCGCVIGGAKEEGLWFFFLFGALFGIPCIVLFCRNGWKD